MRGVMGDNVRRVHMKVTRFRFYGASLEVVDGNGGIFVGVYGKLMEVFLANKRRNPCI
jgi:hypothetical protein